MSGSSPPRPSARDRRRRRLYPLGAALVVLGLFVAYSAMYAAPSDHAAAPATATPTPRAPRCAAVVVYHNGAWTGDTSIIKGTKPVEHYEIYPTLWEITTEVAAGYRISRIDYSMRYPGEQKAFMQDGNGSVLAIDRHVRVRFCAQKRRSSPAAGPPPVPPTPTPTPTVDVPPNNTLS
jgi:hypothetical protein